MTYILVALMFAATGDLQARLIPMDSRNGCDQAAQAVRAGYPDATVICVAVKGQPS